MHLDVGLVSVDDSLLFLLFVYGSAFPGLSSWIMLLFIVDPIVCGGSAFPGLSSWIMLLFIVVPIVCVGFCGSRLFCCALLVSFLLLQSSCRGRVSLLLYFVFLTSCDCHCSMAFSS